MISVYGFALLAHSYLRWLVLMAIAAGLVVPVHALLTRRRWTPFDDRLSSAVVGIADLQLLVGLVLYMLLSPLPGALFGAGTAGLGEPTLRFFGALHPVAMISAVFALHVGKARREQLPDDRARHRSFLLFTATALALVLVALPWPFLSFGRPLLRLSATG